MAGTLLQMPLVMGMIYSGKEAEAVRMSMKEFGTTLCTRQSGRIAYESVMAALDRGENVEFDFSGVDSVTNSFADELFGRLAFRFGINELKRITSFVNVNPTSARFIRSVMEGRSVIAR